MSSSRSHLADLEALWETVTSESLNADANTLPRRRGAHHVLAAAPTGSHSALDRVNSAHGASAELMYARQLWGGARDARARARAHGGLIADVEHTENAGLVGVDKASVRKTGWRGCRRLGREWAWLGSGGGDLLRCATGGVGIGASAFQKEGAGAWEAWRGGRGYTISEATAGTARLAMKVWSWRVGDPELHGTRWCRCSDSCIGTGCRLPDSVRAYIPVASIRVLGAIESQE
ncbi:hypothetical protein B0H10DRAFT_1937809 [Mycena sp. CBHHK59/15]|nr:hypothetical protein B0H10DRAFT_1937809 [Mycena sp. CBHHK59/15]